jgi:hypothetical protein
MANAELMMDGVAGFFQELIAGMTLRHDRWHVSAFSVVLITQM